MSFGLLLEAWIPVRRRSGAGDLVAPCAVAATEHDPVVALAWPRPDFRLACTEFLIGLLATACRPEDHYAWRESYRAPPDAATLEAAFAPLAHAFVLDGDGPRFMQDLADFRAEPNDVGTLLIEAPGENTVKHNTDLMVHRGRVGVLSRAAAAMALFTLQTYAPSGGAGNRTSLRGGGPLTTLAIPPRRLGDAETVLWHTLWANVPVGDPPDPKNLPRVFPWLAATRTSEKEGRATTPPDVDPLQVWWGMPRRIRLDFAANNGAACDLTNRIDTTVVRSWRQRPWGTNYSAWGGLHPLSPCYQAKPNAELLYLHPQPGDIGYQHWLGLLSRLPDATQRVAPAIYTFRTQRVIDVHPGAEPWRLLAAGFDMDKMKARGFAESEMPVFEPRDPAAAAQQDRLVSALVRAANLVATLLARCVRRALFSEGAGVGTDTAPLAALRERFWAETSDAFFNLAERAAAGTDEDALNSEWHRRLRREAERLFAEAAPMDASGEGHPARIAAAMRQLDAALRGFGKDGSELFGLLGMAAPETKPKKARGKAA